MPTIHIPTPLRPYVDKQESVEVAGRTVREALSNLTSTYGDLRKHLYNDEGKLRSFVNIYLNDEDIRYLQKEDTAIQQGDSLSIIPSVAGGIAGALLLLTLPASAFKAIVPGFIAAALVLVVAQPWLTRRLARHHEHPLNARAALPLFLLMVLMVALLYLVPGLATWLPEQMRVAAMR